MTPVHKVRKGKRVTKALSRLKLAVACVLVMVPELLAQTRWMAPGKDRGFRQWVVMLGLLVLISIPAFMNPKRSHLD